MTPTRLFFASVLLGSFGLALLLSPAGGDIGLWVIAFAVEAIRAGLVLVNVEVRKVNPSQYWVVMAAAIIVTFMIAAAITAHIPLYSLEWWAGQATNFIVLAGEYSWAVIRAGAPVDWELEFYRVRSQAEEASAQAEKFRQEADSLRSFPDKFSQATAALQAIQIQAQEQAREIQQQRSIIQTYLSNAGRRISVQSVSASICACGRLNTNGNNHHRKETCECGQPLTYA